MIVYCCQMKTQKALTGLLKGKYGGELSQFWQDIVNKIKNPAGEYHAGLNIVNADRFR